MKKEWGRFIAMQGRLFIGLFENRLDTFQTSNGLFIISNNPIVGIGVPNSSETTYWKFRWIEELDSDILVLNEQDCPEPLEHRQAYVPNQKHFIMSSSYSCQSDVIKKVSGYGFQDNDIELLSSVVLELEKRFITIKAGPVIETTVTEMAPNDLGKLIFSS